MIVVDASVAVKWLVSGRDEDAAEDVLKSEPKVAGPLLFRVEVASAVARKARYREITEAERKRPSNSGRRFFAAMSPSLPKTPISRVPLSCRWSKTIPCKIASTWRWPSVSMLP